MSFQRAACVCALTALVLSGCRTGDPIDYDTAVALLRDRNTEPLKIVFSASPPAKAGNERTAEAYDRLIDAHVIQCTDTRAMGKICEPGPAGEGLTLVGSTELSLVAGRWVPASITHISRSGDGTASAEVRMTFEPSPLYRDFENSFDDIQQSAGVSAIEYKKEGKTVHAVYQHLEDGWHLESVS